MPEPTCEYKFLQYGQLEFKGYVKTSLNGQVVYAEDGITAKYNRYVLEAEFIITRELVDTVESEFNPEYPEEQQADSVDVAMDKIRFQLTRPHCRLVFWHHGAGIILNVLGQSETEESEDSDYKYKNHLWFNLIEGPFPEVIQWEPIGLNNAVRCRWRCTFNLPINESIQNAAWITDNDITSEARMYIGLQPIQTVINNWFGTLYKDPAVDEVGAAGGIIGNYVLSITEEHEFDVSEEGTVVSTLTGVIEFTSSGSRFLNNNGHPSAVPRLIQLMAHYFEPLHPVGFSRSQKYKLRKDKRSLEYVITDRELQSDNPLLPNIVKADVTHSVSSDLVGESIYSGRGFTSWGVNFEGTITVAPGKWKGWAWIAMMCIVNQRIFRTKPMLNDVIAKDAETPFKQPQGTKLSDAKLAGKTILTKISIKERIYSRQVNFSLSYLMLSSLKTLLPNSGLFEPVFISWGGEAVYPRDFGYVPTDAENLSTGLPYNTQWGQSRDSMARTQNVFGYRGPLLPGYNVIFNPYTEEDPNRVNLATTGENAHKRNPEKSYYTPDPMPSTDLVDVGKDNIQELAQHRRNKHLETYSNLNFQVGNLPLFDPTEGASLSGNEQATRIMDNVGGLPFRKPDNPSLPSDIKYVSATNNDTYVLRSSDPDRTWIDYSVKFEMIRNENTQYLPSIAPQYADSRTAVEARPESTRRSHPGNSINGIGRLEPLNGTEDGESKDYLNHAVATFGLPVTYIRCIGRATRLGYPIPAPSLQGIQAINSDSDSASEVPSSLVKAYRVGTSIWRHGMANQSTDMPVYEAEWDILYALQGDPACSNMGYRTVQPSEFV